MSATPRGMSVLEGYRLFRSNKFIVNRKYQRKLVWTLEEKQKLIDSIIEGFPIPLIMLAFNLDKKGEKTFEVLDGMQRLSAIFAFIENRFDWGGKYFNVAHLSRADELSKRGVFDVVDDDTLLLEQELCSSFLEYTLAITEFPSNNESAVTEVFRRINAYGKQLSSQEQRQAGVISPFANLVRELSSELRGDVSKNKLDLSEMPTISVDTTTVGEKEYGISADEMFWCQHGILRKNQLRDSEDEQLVADLVISIVEEQPFAFSGSKLDEYYNQGSEKYKSINEDVISYGTTRIKHEIQSTISIIKSILEDDEKVTSLRSIVHPRTSNPIKTAFHAVFFAFHELCVVQRMSPSNEEEILNALSGLQKQLHVAAGQILSDKRSKNIKITKALIEDFFEDIEPPAIQHGDASSIKFENAIRRSKIETAAFECKQGLLTLSNERAIQPGLLTKIVNTLCGIANIGPESEGGLFIGVADCEKDKQRIFTLDGVQARHLGSRFCVGIDRELQHLELDHEAYVRKIVSHISASELSQALKTSVLSNIDMINYRGLSIVCIWVPPQRELSNVGGSVYNREGSSTKIASSFDEMKEMFGRFG